MFRCEVLLNDFPEYEAGIADLVDRFVGGIKLDDGIPQSASPEFYQHLKENGGLLTLNAVNTSKAMEQSFRGPGHAEAWRRYSEQPR